MGRLLANRAVARYTENINSAAYKSLLTNSVLYQSKLSEEIVANFVEEYLPKIAKSEEHLMTEIKKDRTFIDGLLDIIRGIKNNLAIKFAKSERAMLDEAERNLVNLLRADAKAVDNAKFSISDHIIGASGKDYGKGVILDTDKFEGKSPRKWNDVVKPYVENVLAGNTVTVYNDGIPEIVYFAKKSDRVQKDNSNNERDVLDKLKHYQVANNARNLAIIHIDEMAEASSFHDLNTENSHGWMDLNGWEERKVYAQDIKGNVYEMILNIAKGEDKKILYDISDIKKLKQA